MQRFALWVEFDLKPGALHAFLAVARIDAEGSIAHEPGCRRFDILQDPALPDRVCFYEVYDDEAAFHVHLETAHFKAYNAASQPLIARKKSTRLTVVQHGKA